MATTLASGETILVSYELGFPINEFTLNSSTLNGTDVLDGELVGAAIETYAQSVTINRGRSDQFSPFRAGTCTVTLNNNSRAFDPLNTDSPFYDTVEGRSGVVPRRKLLVKANDVSLFSGIGNDIIISYDDQLSTCIITATDDFARLSRTVIASNVTPSAQLSGARITYLLDLPEIDYPTTRDIDTGTVTLGAYQIDATTNALNYLQQIATAEFGLCFIASNGDLTFADRASAVFATAVATFADTGSDIPYQSLSVRYGTEWLYNRVQATRTGGTVQTADDATSQTEFGIVTLDIPDLLLSTDAQALTLAQAIVDLNGQPQYLFDDLSVSMTSLSNANRTVVNSVDIGDLISVTKSFDTGTPATVTGTYQVQSVRHSVTPSQHTVVFGLQYVALVYALVLDDAVLGVLDADNALS